MPQTADKYANGTRTRQTFRLRAREHRGGRDGNERLVCYLEGEPGLLAIWGTRGTDMQHIEAVERVGFPLTIECDWIEPDTYEATNFGHKYWVREGDHLRILR
jgi:hypothetical protein